MTAGIDAVCKRHLEFMKWADDRLVAACASIPAERANADLGSSFQSIFGTLCHVYKAELIWYERVQGRIDKILSDLETPADLETLTGHWAELHRQWLDWATSLSSEEDWSRIAPHRDSKGNLHEIPVWQIVLHLVNHGTYHRGQVSTLMRQSRIVPPATDLIAFYRLVPAIARTA